MPSVRIIKAIHIVVDGFEAPLKKLHNYDGIADALILDSVNLKEDRIGGTGITHDWTLSKKMVDNSHLLPMTKSLYNWFFLLLLLLFSSCSIAVTIKNRLTSSIPFTSSTASSHSL